MNRELHELEIDKLQAMYQAETNHLNTELLAGASWESLREQKVRVTELAIILHKKKKDSYLNPAEFNSSRHQDTESFRS
jgi:hypothetical protein